jgi:flagellar biosynthetic protein FliR
MPLTLELDQFADLLTQFLLPFFRIGACLSVAPLFGAAFVPPRVRIVLSAALAVLVVGLGVPVPPHDPLSLAMLLAVLREVVVGLGIGFVLQIVFDAVAMGGQLLANGMGLSFAFLVDPLRGSSTAALGQLYLVLSTLTFIAFGGHLALIALLVDGFRGLPPGAEQFGAQQLIAIVKWGGQIFAGSLQVALPGVTALVMVNIGFGIVSRSAPTLNLLAVGGNNY